MQTRSGAYITAFSRLLRHFCLTYPRYAFKKVPCMERKFGHICYPRSLHTRPRVDIETFHFIFSYLSDLAPPQLGFVFLLKNFYNMTDRLAAIRKSPILVHNFYSGK